jgi:hypothetical protein
MNGLPSGDGKYMWADGSCYVGSWLGGMPDGTGIYSWASGAFFEGGWKQGCMEGQGTYSDGAIGIYLGSWHDHKMHGCVTTETLYCASLRLRTPTPRRKYRSVRAWFPLQITTR